MNLDSNVKNNKLGYLVGILGGLLFSLPWILVFAFLNMSSGYLAFLIVFGIIKGYKLVNKKIYNDNKTKLYLVISSVIIVILGVFLFIPLLQLLKQGNINNEMIKFIYTSKEFLNSTIINIILALVMVLIPSLLFPIDFKLRNSDKSEPELFTEELINIFKKHGAVSKETAVDKNIIKEEIEKVSLGKAKKAIYLDILKNSLIRNYKGKCFLNSKQKKNNKIGLGISIGLLIIFVSCWNLCASTIFDINNNYNNTYGSEKRKESKLVDFKINDELTINMPDCLKLYSNNHNTTNNVEVFYYQYLSQNVQKSNIEVIEIQYYPAYYINDMYDEFKNYMREVLSEYNIIAEENKVINDNNVIYFKVNKLEKDRVTNVYFVPEGNKLVELYIHINDKKYNKFDDELSDEIIKSIKITNQL